MRGVNVLSKMIERGGFLDGTLQNNSLLKVLAMILQSKMLKMALGLHLFISLLYLQGLNILDYSYCEVLSYSAFFPNFKENNYSKVLL